MFFVFWFGRSAVGVRETVTRPSCVMHDMYTYVQLCICLREDEFHWFSRQGIDATREKSFPVKQMYSLEGDGVCEHLYEFISCKDELSFRPTINIADTIVYKFGQPVSWYFTGVDGKVKKKFKTNIINAKIEEAFIKASVGSDVVAYYISWTSNASKYQDGESSFFSCWNAADVIISKPTYIKT